MRARTQRRTEERKRRKAEAKAAPEQPAPPPEPAPTPAEPRPANRRLLNLLMAITAPMAAEIGMEMPQARRKR